MQSLGPNLQALSAKLNLSESLVRNRSSLSLEQTEKHD